MISPAPQGRRGDNLVREHTQDNVVGWNEVSAYERKEDVQIKPKQGNP